MQQRRGKGEQKSNFLSFTKAAHSLPLAIELTLRIRNTIALRILNQNTFPAAPQNTIYWQNKSAKALTQHPLLSFFLRCPLRCLRFIVRKRTRRWASIIESGKGMLSVPSELSARGGSGSGTSRAIWLSLFNVETDSLAADYQEDITRICQVIGIRIACPDSLKM